jgi:hypothetical protein
VLKIYSINEIIEATNKLLLETQDDEKNLIKNDNDITDGSINELTKPNIKNEKTIFLERSIPKEIEGIILEAENSQIQNNKNKPIKVVNQQDEDSVDELKVSKDELIESMHKTFSKKIKKNTLKLILDLREEIIFLTKKISSLKEKEKKERFNKKIIYKNIIDLKQIENELNLNLNKIKKDFNSSKEQNQNLNSDYNFLKEQNQNLNEKNIFLKEQNQNLNEKNVLLNNDLLSLRKISVQLKNQSIILKNNNIKINSQLVAYKNKDLISKSKITKLEEEILTNSNLLNETNENNKEINLQLNEYKNKDLISKSKITKLEEEILTNSNLLNETNENNKEINLQLNEINKFKKDEKELRINNQELEKTIEDLKLNINTNENNLDINKLEDKIKHYQEENIRISSELVESNKKFEITKESLGELQGHRSHLIEKINSINEVIKNENVVTSAFSNNLGENKIKVTDSNKLTKENMIDVDKEIKNIFANK